MRGALENFRQEISQLNEFLEAAMVEERLYPLLAQTRVDSDDGAARDAITKFLEATVNKRKYTYAVSVISLYGALESYVRGVVEQYLSAISRLSGGVTGLPDRIAENHTALSINYLVNVRDRKINNDDTVELVVARLAKCLARADDFELNANAFLMKGQNVNRDRIRQTASELGIFITPKRLIRTVAATRYFSERDPSVLETSSDEVAQAQFAAIDAVTDARNLIAHGVAELIQIESPNVLLGYAEEITAYCEAVTSICEQEFISHAIARGSIMPLSAPVRTFGDNIVCFALNDGCISVGDILILSLDDSMEPLRFSRIESLQVDGLDQAEVVGCDGLNVGVRVTFRVTQRPNYCVLSKAARQIIFPE